MLRKIYLAHRIKQRVLAKTLTLGPKQQQRIKEEQATDFRFICCDQSDQAQRAVKQALDCCQESPVILFAARTTVLDFGSKPQDLYLKRPVTSQGALDCLEEIKCLKRGMLVLDFAHTHGIDPRFQEDAQVVLTHDGNIEMEKVQQALSRGSRSLGTKKGYIFKVA
jgi:xanthine/CO dehydrogenase XdhC/CoxF family maturation factor